VVQVSTVNRPFTLWVWSCPETTNALQFGGKEISLSIADKGTETMMAESTKKMVHPEELERYCTAALRRAGLNEKDARTSARVLVTNDTWGIHTHGARQFRGLLRAVKAGRLNANAAPEVVAQGPAWALVDGHHAFPMVIASHAMKTAIDKARVSGMAYVGVKNSSHFGAAGYYANMAADEDMIGVAVSNTDPIMTVPGSRARIFGTNPFSYAVPTGEEKPIFLDIAVSAVAATKVLAAREVGQQVPRDWIVDKEGMPTTDPNEFMDGGAMVPMAGHKGYGLALLIEVLAAVMTGAGITQEVPSWIVEQPNPVGQGHAFIAIDVSKIMPVEAFKGRMDRMIREIRLAPKAKNSERIYLPGEMEWERRAVALKQGMQLPDHVIGSLTEMAQEWGLESELKNLLG
jgi:ureidoglycolate dehydrogenase (NAD+)